MTEASTKLVYSKRKGLSEHLFAHCYAEKVTSNKINRAILDRAEYTNKPDKQQTTRKYAMKFPENKIKGNLVFRKLKCAQLKSLITKII